MYLTYNEGKSVVAERFNKLWRVISIKKLMIYNSRSYLDYLDKLADEYHNTYHHSIGKKPIDADYSALKLVIESGLQSTRIFSTKVAPIVGQKNICY